MTTHIPATSYQLPANFVAYLHFVNHPIAVISPSNSGINLLNNKPQMGRLGIKKDMPFFILDLFEKLSVLSQVAQNTAYFVEEVVRKQGFRTTQLNVEVVQ